MLSPRHASSWATRRASRQQRDCHVIADDFADAAEDRRAGSARCSVRSPAAREVSVMGGCVCTDGVSRSSTGCRRRRPARPSSPAIALVAAVGNAAATARRRTAGRSMSDLPVGLRGARRRAPVCERLAARRTAARGRSCSRCGACGATARGARASRARERRRGRRPPRARTPTPIEAMAWQARHPSAPARCRGVRTPVAAAGGGGGGEPRRPTAARGGRGVARLWQQANDGGARDGGGSHGRKRKGGGGGGGSQGSRAELEVVVLGAPRRRVTSVDGPAAENRASAARRADLGAARRADRDRQATRLQTSRMSS